MVFVPDLQQAKLQLHSTSCELKITFQVLQSTLKIQRFYSVIFSHRSAGALQTDFTELRKVDINPVPVTEEPRETLRARCVSLI